MTASADEAARLAALDRYHIVDTAPEPAFDALTRLAARICTAPMAALSLVEGDRQWFKSKLGLPFDETPRSISFCAHTILRPALLVVADTLNDERFAENPLVTDGPQIRAYAGAPLVTQHGQRLGALSVMDNVPRALDGEQRALLRILADEAMRQLDLRRAVHDASQPVRNRLELILNAAGEGICGLDETGRVIFINPAATHMLGYGSEALSGENFHLLVHHSCADGSPYPGARCSLTTVLRPGQTRKAGDDVFCRKDGTPLPVGYVSTPMVDADQPAGAVIAFHDVTDERRTERALRDSVRRLRLIIDAVPSSIAYGDSSQRYRFNNRACETRFGLARNEIRGRHVREMLGDSAFESVRRHQETVLRGREVSFESRAASRTGGDARHTSTSLIPDISAQGRVQGYIALVNDITARVRVEQDLERFFNVPLHLMCVAGTDGYFKRLNPAFEALLGYSEQELLIRPFLHFVHPRDRHATIEELGRISAGAATKQFENRYRCRDGSYRWLSWATFPVVDEGLVYAMALEITDRKRATLKRRARTRDAGDGAGLRDCD